MHVVHASTCWRGVVPAREQWSVTRSARWLAPAVASVVLLPWVLYLGVTLPGSYVTQGWDVAWVGFDVVLSASLAATAALVLVRHRLAGVVTSATAALLLCDGWFDVVTSASADRLGAALSLCVEVPFAIFLFVTAARASEPAAP